MSLHPPPCPFYLSLTPVRLDPLVLHMLRVPNRASSISTHPFSLVFNVPLRAFSISNNPFPAYLTSLLDRYSCLIFCNPHSRVLAPGSANDLPYRTGRLDGYPSCSQETVSATLLYTRASPSCRRFSSTTALVPFTNGAAYICSTSPPHELVQAV